MAIIELGVVNHGQDHEPPGRPAWRELGRRPARSVLVAVVAAFCLLAVTGSTRPDPRGLKQLWAVAFQAGPDSFLLGQDTAFLLTRSAGLTAYDVRTGAVRWTRPGFDDASWLIDLRAGVLLVPAAYTTVAANEFSQETVAVDAATGREVWRQHGELGVTMTDRALLTERDNAGEVRNLRLVRLRDGGTIWSRPTGSIVSWVTDAGPGAAAERLATVDFGGHTRVLDLADGSVVSTATLPWDDRSPDDGDNALLVKGRQLFLDHGEGGDRATLTAYDTETMREQWHVERDGPGSAYSCGPMLCITTARGTAGYDRATGLPRWQISGGANGFALPERLVLAGDEAEAEARRLLLDAATGRKIADVGSGLPVWDQWRDEVPYLTSRTLQPADFMLVSRLDEDTGEVLLRGRIPEVMDYSCRATARLLACITTDNRLVVTDLG